MKIKFSTLTITLLSFLTLSFGTNYSVKAADETIKEKAKEAANDAKRGAKKGARAVDDKVCELVNGKMECVAKKVKHSIQNGADKVDDAID